QERIQFENAAQQSIAEYAKLEKECMNSEKKLSKLEQDIQLHEKQLQQLQEKIQKEKQLHKETQDNLLSLVNEQNNIRKNLDQQLSEVRKRDTVFLQILNDEKDAFIITFGTEPSTEESHEKLTPKEQRQTISLPASPLLLFNDKDKKSIPERSTSFRNVEKRKLPPTPPPKPEQIAQKVRTPPTPPPKTIGITRLSPTKSLPPIPPPKSPRASFSSNMIANAIAAEKFKPKPPPVSAKPSFIGKPAIPP